MHQYNLGFIGNQDLFNHVQETVLKYRFVIDLKKFNKNIIIKGSFFEQTYKKELKARLETTEDKAPFNLPASSVANTVLKIMQTQKPKPRYYVTKATYILGFAKRVLSQKWLDKLLQKV